MLWAQTQTAQEAPQLLRACDHEIVKKEGMQYIISGKAHSPNASWGSLGDINGCDGGSTATSIAGSNRGRRFEVFNLFARVYSSQEQWAQLCAHASLTRILRGLYFGRQKL